MHLIGETCEIILVGTVLVHWLLAIGTIESNSWNSSFDGFFNEYLRCILCNTIIKRSFQLKWWHLLSSHRHRCTYENVIKNRYIHTSKRVLNIRIYAIHFQELYAIKFSIHFNKYKKNIWFNHCADESKLKWICAGDGY